MVKQRKTKFNSFPRSLLLELVVSSSWEKLLTPSSPTVQRSWVCYVVIHMVSAEMSSLGAQYPGSCLPKLTLPCTRRSSLVSVCGSHLLMQTQIPSSLGGTLWIALPPLLSIIPKRQGEKKAQPSA